MTRSPRRPPHREEPPSASLPVWVQPGASRQRVIGLHGDAVKIAVTAPPEKGAANRAVEKLLAGEFGLAAGAAEVVAGGASRRKQVQLRGVSPEQVRTWVERQKSNK